MRISSLLKSSLILSIFLFSKSSIGVSNVWSEVSPLCNPSLTNFTIDATAKYNYRKQIYFFTGSMRSVVDTTTNRVVDSSKISEHYGDCGGKRISSVDVASDAFSATFGTERHYLYKLGAKSLEFIQIYQNHCSSGATILPIEDRGMTLDETINIYTKVDYFRLTQDYQNQLMAHYSDSPFYAASNRAEDNLMSYYLRTRTRNGRKEVAIVIDQSDPSSELSQLNGHNITSLLYLPPSMSNSLFKGEQIILFANRYLTYVSKEADKWIPFKVKNFAEVVCRTSSATEPTEPPETTIPTTTISPTGIESPICKHSVTDLTIDSTAKHRDRKHVYFFTGEEITVVDTTRNQLNHSSKIADYFIGSTDDWHSADLAISHNNLVIYQFDQDNDTQLSISYDSLQIIDRNTSTANSWWRSHLDLDFEFDQYIHLIRRPDHLLIGFSTDNENSVLYQLKLRSQHIGLTNDSTFRTSNLVQLNGHNITSLIVLPDYMSNDVFRSGKILLFANRFFTEVLNRPNKWTPFKVKNFAEVICQNSWITTTTTTTTTSTTTTSTTTQRPTQTTSITTTKATKPTITSTTTKASKRTEPTITFTTTKRTKRTKTTDWMHIEIQTDNISAILISVFLLLLLCVIAFIVWFVFIRDKRREEMQSIQQRPEYNSTSGPPQVVSPNAIIHYQSEDQSNIAPTNPSVEQTSPVMQTIQQSQEYNSYPPEEQPFQSNHTLEPQSADQYQYPSQTPPQHQYTPQPQQQSFNA